MKVTDTTLFFIRLVIGGLLISLFAVGCGGDSSNDGLRDYVYEVDPFAWVKGEFVSPNAFDAKCENPRSDPNFADQQGTALDEKNWLRSWSNEYYLWYNEITDRDPSTYDVLDYFALLKTDETLPSGRPKDHPGFHFTYETETWRQLSQSGVSSGYGLSWAILESRPPRKVVVAHTEPGTSATSEPASLTRGALLLEIDGVDVVNATSDEDIALVNASLYPNEDGISHSFTFLDLKAETPRTFTMESGAFVSTPVQFVKTLETDNGKVGYMLFKSHIAIAEAQLIEAVEQLAAEGISDLVIDLRYNGGGYLVMASQLAYMVAGHATTAGQVFERQLFNDKYPDINPITGTPLRPTGFFRTTVGLSTEGGQPLPALNLNRVFVLTSGSTCSASESLINGLRGVDVEVIQIGTTTCGKPYGFYPIDNCGTTYFSIQFTGVNAKGFGEFGDGFTPANTVDPDNAGTPVPGCEVADDFEHDFGDPQEARLAAALLYRETGSCPELTVEESSGGLGKTSVPVRPSEPLIRTTPGLQSKIMLQ